MIIYDLSFINNYHKSIESETIDDAIQNLLNIVLETINNDLSLNICDIDLDNKFKKKNKFRKYDNYSNSNSNSNSNNNSNSNSNSSTAKDYIMLNRNNKNTYVTTKKKNTEEKSKLDSIKSNIKILLNKLSPSNYAKLEKEFVNMYDELLDSKGQVSSEDHNNIDNYIIDYICYNNLSYSAIYVNILFSIINLYYIKDYKLEDIYIYNLLKEKYNGILKFEKYITINIDDDDYTINKNNDKYKCFIIFIINFNKKIYYYELENVKNKDYVNELFINCFVIEDFISLLNNFFITNLQIARNTIYCEIILEFLITIYSELFKEIKIMIKIDQNTNLYKQIKSILTNNNEYPCFTNKIKFKLMDIEDKYKKYIL